MITSLTEEQCDYLEKLSRKSVYTTGFYINTKHELSLLAISKWQAKNSLASDEFITDDFNEFITLYEQHQLLKTLGE